MSDPARAGGGLPSWWLVLPWLVGSAWAVWLGFKDFGDLNGMHIGRGLVVGRDFANMWTGGRLALEGRLGILYDTLQYHQYQRQLFGGLGLHAYSYPPHSIFLAAPLALLPYPVALVAWLAGTAALFAYAARPYVADVPGLAPWAALLTPAATINLWAAHYGFFVGGLWLLCFSAMTRGEQVRAGAWGALLSLKPHLALVVPLIVIARRRWRTALVAALGVLLLLVTSGLVLGFDRWPDFLDKTFQVQSRLLQHQRGYYRQMMPTPWILFQSLGLSGLAAVAAQFASGLFALAMVARALRGGASITDLALVGATATFILLPYAFNYDMTVASLGMAIMLHRQWHELGWTKRAVLMLGFVVPQLVMAQFDHFHPLSAPILMAALWVQVGAALAWQERISPARAGRAAAAEAHSI